MRHYALTEGGPDYTFSGLSNPTGHTWGRTFTQAMAQLVPVDTGWNLAPDEKGPAQHCPFPAVEQVRIHPRQKEITRSGQYWAFGHFFAPRAPRSQTIRIRSQPDRRWSISPPSKIRMGARHWS